MNKIALNDFFIFIKCVVLITEAIHIFVLVITFNLYFYVIVNDLNVDVDSYIVKIIIKLVLMYLIQDLLHIIYFNLK
jgi:hypothetical protein